MVSMEGKRNWEKMLADEGIPREPDTGRNVDLSRLGRPAHDVVDEKDEPVMVLDLQERGELVEMLPELPPEVELIIRLRLGIGDPSMDYERIQSVLRDTEDPGSVSDILRRAKEQRQGKGPDAREFPEAADGLTFEEIGSVFGKRKGQAREWFTKARRVMRNFANRRRASQV